MSACSWQYLGHAYSGMLECEWIEACLEGVREYLQCQHSRRPSTLRNLTTACSGSSRSSSPDLPLFWPLLPFGGMFGLW